MCSLKQFSLIHFWPSSSVQRSTLDRNCDRIRHSKLRTSHVQKTSKDKQSQGPTISKYLNPRVALDALACEAEIVGTFQLLAEPLPPQHPHSGSSQGPKG